MPFTGCLSHAHTFLQNERKTNAVSLAVGVRPLFTWHPVATKPSFIRTDEPLNVLSKALAGHAPVFLVCCPLLLLALHVDVLDVQALPDLHSALQALLRSARIAISYQQLLRQRQPPW